MMTNEDAKKLHEQMNFCYEVYNTNKDLCEFCRNQYLKLAKHFSDFEFYARECQKQKAEIERLQRHNKEYGFCNLLGNCLVYSKNLTDYNDMRKGLKAEAIKEFAERLKKYVKEYIPFFWEDICRKIDNLVKELTDGKEGAGNDRC